MGIGTEGGPSSSRGCSCRAGPIIAGGRGLALAAPSPGWVARGEARRVREGATRAVWKYDEGVAAAGCRGHMRKVA